MHEHMQIEENKLLGTTGYRQLAWKEAFDWLQVGSLGTAFLTCVKTLVIPSVLGLR